MSLCVFPIFSFSFEPPVLTLPEIVALLVPSTPDFNISIDLSCPLD